MSLEDRDRSMSDCTRCSNCRWLPSIDTEEFAHVCPSIRYGKVFSYSGGGKAIMGYALLHGKIGYDEGMLDAIYACSACGGCQVVCGTFHDDMVEPLEAIYALRERVVQDGQLPASLKALTDNLRSTGNVAGSTDGNRGAWCASLSRTAPERPDMVLLVGDAALDREQWPQLQRLVATLDASGASFTIAGAAEVDCGGLAFEVGDQALARTLAEKVVALVRESGARSILTQDDALFAALRGYYPRMGVTLPVDKVVHVTQWLARHKPPIAAHQGEAVTYHDTCRLGRLGEPYVPWSGWHDAAFAAIRVRQSNVPVLYGNGGVYDEPRALIAATGAEIREMPRIRETSFCCGLGGGGGTFNPEFATMAARDRLTEALSTGAKTLVTSSAECACHLRAVAQRERLPIAVSNLIDYIAPVEG